MILSLTGCIGLGKRSDATDAESATKHIVRKFASELELRGTLSRNSGGATAIRLKKLFPTYDVERYILGLGKATSQERATSRNFTSKERPSAALAQMAL